MQKLNVVAVAGNEADILGNLVITSISRDIKIEPADLDAIFKDLDVSDEFFPPEINLRDAFRKACSAVKEQKFKDGDNTVKLMIRDVISDKERIEKQVVREVSSSSNVPLEYTPLFQAVIEGERNKEEFKTSILDYNYSPREYDILQEIEKQWKENSCYYDGEFIRRLVMRFLDSISSIAVKRSGGVYFVPQRCSDEVAKLDALIKRIVEKQPTASVEYGECWVVPVIDGEDRRAMVASGIEETAKSASDSLMTEMADYLKSGKSISERKLNTFLERGRSILSLVSEYKEILNDELLGCEIKVEGLRQQLLGIANLQIEISDN